MGGGGRAGGGRGLRVHAAQARVPEALPRTARRSSSPSGATAAPARCGWGSCTAAWCVGCCWALMAALFALGAMSLAWMIVIALLIAVEKLLPVARRRHRGRRRHPRRPGRRRRRRPRERAGPHDPLRPARDGDAGDGPRSPLRPARDGHEGDEPRPPRQWRGDGRTGHGCRPLALTPGRSNSLGRSAATTSSRATARPSVPAGGSVAAKAVDRRTGSVSVRCRGPSSRGTSATSISPGSAQ